MIKIDTNINWLNSWEGKEMVIGLLLGSCELKFDGLGYYLKVKKIKKKKWSIMYLRSFFDESLLSPIFVYNVGVKYLVFFVYLRVNEYGWLKWMFFSRMDEKSSCYVLHHTIERYISFRLMAFWFVDNGYFNKIKGNVYFLTENYTRDELKELILMIDRRLNVKLRVHTMNKKLYLYVKASSRDLLLDSIKEFYPERWIYEGWLVYGSRPWFLTHLKLNEESENFWVDYKWKKKNRQSRDQGRARLKKLKKKNSKN